MQTKPINFMRLGASAGEPESDWNRLVEPWNELAARVSTASGQRYVGANGDAVALLAGIGEFLALMQTLDREYGPSASLPLVDAGEAADTALRCVGELGTWLVRLDLQDGQPVLSDVAIAAGVWAMRHDLPIRAAEPLVNALAMRANHAATRQEVAAVFGLMQGVVAWLQGSLGADLERSNPERPWRVLNLNFAITAIRSGDEILMRHAFAALEANLPDETVGFYREALELAERVGLPSDAQALLRGRLAAVSARLGGTLARTH